MNRRARKLQCVVLIVAGCLVAGCGAYGPSIVQGSSKDTPLEAGIGQQFQKLVPPRTAVQDVRCVRLPTTTQAGVCKIDMIRDKPDPIYTYLVTKGGHRFLAYSASNNKGGSWTPPAGFSGGY